MLTLDHDPREVIRGFSTPINLRVGGPATMIDNRVIIKAMTGREILVVAPHSIPVVSEEYLQRRGGKLPVRHNPAGISRLFVNILEGKSSNTYIGDHMLEFLGSDLAGDSEEYDFILRSPKPALVHRTIGRRINYAQLLTELASRRGDGI